MGKGNIAGLFRRASEGRYRSHHHDSPGRRRQGGISASAAWRNV